MTMVNVTLLFVLAAWIVGRDDGRAARRHADPHPVGRRLAVPTLGASLPTGACAMAGRRRTMFVPTSRNARSATGSFRLPPNRAAGPGAQLDS